MKECTKCEVAKELTEFRFHKNKQIHANVCKHCNYLRDNAKRIARGDTYREVTRKRAREYRLTYKGMMNNRRGAWKRQGIDPDKAEAYFLEHHGLCDLCGKDVEANGKALAIDHCHETGDIRGMLCSNCNRGIGLLQHDWELLNRASKYVMKWRDTPTRYPTWHDLAKDNKSWLHLSGKLGRQDIS